MSQSSNVYDVVVIGAGFGGLSSALYLAENNKRVLLAEMLKYPGGCASTFSKKDAKFEAGATLFSGFHEGGLFDTWIKKHKMDVQFSLLDPMISFHSESMQIEIHPDREKTIAQFCALPNAPTDNIRKFFAYQRDIADILWPIFDDAHRLPPFSWTGMGWHAKRSFLYPKLLSLFSVSMQDVLAKFALENYAPIVAYCNALCQITIQCTIERADAIFALSAMDYVFRGTGHIDNGIGTLANAMLSAIEKCGGEYRLSAKVKKIRKKGSLWELDIRGETVLSKHIIANMLPMDVIGLVDNGGQDFSSLIATYTNKLQQGWGAVMLYAVVKDGEYLPQDPHHYQSILQADVSLQEGNHLFCSISGRKENKAKEGYRTMTVSTHVPMDTYVEKLNSSTETVASYIESIQQRLRDHLQQRFPEIYQHIETMYTASPRTFQRFTGRTNGMVGGIPRYTGQNILSTMYPKELHSGLANLWIVGDTVFPGQSTLSTSIGGICTARRVLQCL